ncbi:hypothetical protein [Corynebacterium renale]|uniref:ATP/GTP-binding protein n=1 Tax=Corynebacterium renale TaxID=1724 RepID=A0A2A9DQP1_9CORY|nr:hypothetical protein [Corynebacterium renale]PFG28904.1 hypothetical protein ATK06_2033 [Corynebacterium renale]SQI25605.1 Uncharacterised protein [Corynebacterium renale]
MGRKNRRIRGRDTRPLPRDGATLYGLEETEGPSWTHGDIYLVRRIGSARAVKYYVCPGCNQQIVPGVAHVVAWPKYTGRQGEDRRHWHNHCWQRR